LAALCGGGLLGPTDPAGQGSGRLGTVPWRHARRRSAGPEPDDEEASTAMTDLPALLGVQAISARRPL
jgi:hypothetical protein